MMPSLLATQPLLPSQARARSVEGISIDLRAVCGSFTIEPASLSDGVVYGDVRVCHAARFETAVVSLDALRVKRDETMIRRDPGDHLFLIIQDEGSCRVHQRDQMKQLVAGDMFLVDSTQPSDFVYNGTHGRQVSIHLPRNEMVHRFGEACTGGVAFSRNDPLFVAMRAVLAKLFTEGAGAEPQLSEALLSLMGAWFHCLEQQTGKSTRVANAVLSRALVLIDRHSDDPAFGPTELAAQLQVSPRTLQRHFNQLGETASRQLLAVRLDNARARLDALGGGAESVSSIAFGAGFNDLSYFYRCFRERFGEAPGRLRKP